MYIGITHATVHISRALFRTYKIYARFYRSRAEVRKNWNVREILFLLVGRYIHNITFYNSWDITDILKICADSNIHEKTIY